MLVNTTTTTATATTNTTNTTNTTTTTTTTKRRRRGQNASTNPGLEEIEVDLDVLRESLKCELCKNLLRDANTVTECLHSFCFDCISSKIIVGKNNLCPACPSEKMTQSLGVDPFLDKKIITDGRKNHLCQTFREMFLTEGEGSGTSAKKDGEERSRDT